MQIKTVSKEVWDMSSTYRVTIKIDDDTLAELKNNDFKLYAFRAVQSNASGGKPVVWYMTDDILESSILSWKADYGAFVSREGLSGRNNSETISNGANFSSVTNKPIDLGQSMIISEKGVANVDSVGIADTISIVNNHYRTYSCGISEDKGNNEFNPLCAFPILATITDMITPIAKVALMFATDTVETATVIEKAISPGIIIDLTTAPSRNVEYNLKTKWKVDAQGKSQSFNSNDPLSPLLINPAK